jgi:uncharacterized OB-fold protein
MRSPYTGKELYMMDVSIHKCSSCGRFQSPPAYFCVSCKSDELEWTQIPGKGTLHTYSTVYVPLASLENEAPYTVAIVEFLEGLKLTGRLVNLISEDLAIGTQVEVVGIRDGVYYFGICK